MKSTLCNYTAKTVSFISEIAHLHDTIVFLLSLISQQIQTINRIALPSVLQLLLLMRRTPGTCLWFHRCRHAMVCCETSLRCSSVSSKLHCDLWLLPLGVFYLRYHDCSSRFNFHQARVLHLHHDRSYLRIRIPRGVVLFPSQESRSMGGRAPSSWVFVWTWSGLVLGLLWARWGFSVGFVCCSSSRGLVS